MKLKEKNKKEGFIVRSLVILFYILEKISVFYWIRELNKKKDKKNEFIASIAFPELWVLGNIVLAVGAQLLIGQIAWKWLSILCMVYAVERVFEIFVYQVNVLFFHRIRWQYLEEDEGKKDNAQIKLEEQKPVISYTRTVILLIFNMIEYVLQFAVIYVALINIDYTIGPRIHIWQSFQIFMSMQDLNDFNGNKIAVFAYVETLLGVFMNIVCLAHFVGVLNNEEE